MLFGIISLVLGKGKEAVADYFSFDTGMELRVVYLRGGKMVAGGTYFRDARNEPNVFGHP